MTQSTQSEQVLREYAVVRASKVSYVQVPLEPTVYLPIQLAALEEAEKKYFQLWHWVDGMWHPIYGAEGQAPVLEIMGPNIEEFYQIQNAEFLELGNKAVKLYVEWRRRSKLYSRQIARRQGLDDHVVEHMQAEKLKLDKNVLIIDEIIQSLPDKFVQLFELRYRKEYEQEKIVQLMNYSSSSINRYTSEIKAIVGRDLHKLLTNEEIEDTFNVVWPHEKWRFGRSRDL